MNAWWLALDTEWTSYAEIKGRKVIAQGWPRLGNLSGIVELAGHRSTKPIFEERFRKHSADVLGAGSLQYLRCNKMMWRFMSVEKGDLFVAIEGTTVRGICRLDTTVKESYRLDDVRKYNYAQAYGYPVEWIDWRRDVMGSPPVAPRQSVLGIAGIRNDRERVFEAWDNYLEYVREQG